MSHLVMSRKRGETIRYVVKPSMEETVIEVSVTRIDGSRVRLSSEAPPHVQIVRAEMIGEPNDELPIERDHDEV